MAEAGENTQDGQTSIQKATGPRSKAGKERSSHNAVQHGIFADIVLTGPRVRESLKDYTRLLEVLVEDFQPVGAVEQVLVEQLAFEFLRLGRFYKADVQIARRVFERLEADLKESDASVFSLADPKQEAVIVRKELASELLLRYGNTVSKQIHRILDRIERLQRIRKGQPVPPPIAVNISD